MVSTKPVPTYYNYKCNAVTESRTERGSTGIMKIEPMVTKRANSMILCVGIKFKHQQLIMLLKWLDMKSEIITTVMMVNWYKEIDLIIL